MRRSFSVIAFILLLALMLGAWAYAEDTPAAPSSGSGSVSAFSWSATAGEPGKIEVPKMPGMNNQIYQRLMSMNTMSVLKWPDKNISLDVKDTSIRSIAKMLGDQTGIKFDVKQAVPSDLKITIQMSNMSIKQFLDTLCAATNLTYTAESRAEIPKPKPSADGSKPEKSPKAPPAPAAPSAGGGAISFSAPQIQVVPTGEGFEMVAPSGQQVVMLNVGKGKPVTNVIISSLAAEGVIVNMGMVSMSVKDVDPVDVATRLIKQIKGASYMIMDLKDYLSLQDPERAAEIEKALQKTPRSKITMSFRNAPITSALQKIAEAGHFYITNPQPGQSNFLIIPDVKVLDTKVMPGLSFVPWVLTGMIECPPLPATPFIGTLRKSVRIN